MIFIVKKNFRMLIHMWDSAESNNVIQGEMIDDQTFKYSISFHLLRNKKCSRTVAILSSHSRVYFGGGYISSKILQWEKDEISLFLLHFNIAWSLRFSTASVLLWLEWNRFRKFYISKSFLYSWIWELNFLSLKYKLENNRKS